MTGRGETELLPCPFCGSSGEIVKNAFWRHPSCSNPNCVAHVCEQDEQGGTLVDFRSDAEAAKLWNARTAVNAYESNQARIEELKKQLERANRIIGWMMPYIGNMCPPADGLSDLNIHCCENKVPMPDKSTKGAPIDQRATLSKGEGGKP